MTCELLTESMKLDEAKGEICLLSCYYCVVLYLLDYVFHMLLEFLIYGGKKQYCAMEDGRDRRREITEERESREKKKDAMCIIFC